MVSPELDCARCFAFPGEILGVTAYGSGNVNDTYLVRVGAGAGAQAFTQFILQRLNPAVFPEPEKIMANLRVLDNHVRPKLAACPERRWELPGIIPTLAGADYHRDQNGVLWRAQTFITGAESCAVITTQAQAEEAGRGLGFFHALIRDLPANLLHDTLPGFHVTPEYLARYKTTATAPARPDSSAEALFCRNFIEERQGSVQVLEEARARGELTLRPIHGDPKPGNLLFAADTGEVVSLIDLDTVKPGLIHYDLGDCLRACANPAGEEAEPSEILFDPALAGGVLKGYLSEVAEFFTSGDYQYIYDAARLIAFELGLRFFSDHLAGDLYFKVRSPGQNLRRAMVQFALCRRIEAQEQEIKKMVEDFRKS